MNDYERKQAEELAAQRYPYSGKPGERALAQRAFIAGYEAALETVAPEPTEQLDTLDKLATHWRETYPTEFPGGPTLDPLPYVDGEDGPDKEIRQAHPDPWTEFAPREGYSQNREDYE